AAYIFHAEQPLNLELASFFSRKEEYDALYKQLSELRDRQTKDEKKELLKQIRKLRKSIDALVESYLYPDETPEQEINEHSAIQITIT
ncbi:chromate resistance protein, partial [Acinetobacter baumannii]